jgi:hypothetical protein
MCKSGIWRTETGELLGGYPNAVEDLAQSGPGRGRVLNHRFEDVVKKAPSGIGRAVDLEGGDGRRGQEVLVKL